MSRSASDDDFFDLLGLPHTHRLERDQIEEAYLERAQRVHPDRFAGAASEVRRGAMEESSRLNEGVRVLRDPVKRAEYMVKLGGIDLDSSDPEHGAPSMPQTFLVEMIERREAVEEARQVGGVALQALYASVEDEADALLDEAVSKLEADDVAAAALRLVERRYLQRLLDEIEGNVEH